MALFPLAFWQLLEKDFLSLGTTDSIFWFFRITRVLRQSLHETRAAFLLWLLLVLDGRKRIKNSHDYRSFSSTEQYWKHFHCLKLFMLHISKKVAYVI